MFVRFQTDARDFPLLKNVQTGPGIHPAFCSLFTGSFFFTGVECPGCAVPNRCGTAVTDKWIYTSASLCAFMSRTGTSPGTRGGAVGCGTALQAGSSRLRFPMGVTGIFRWYNPAGRTIALGSTKPLTGISTKNISCEIKTAGAWG